MGGEAFKRRLAHVVALIIDQFHARAKECYGC